MAFPLRLALTVGATLAAADVGAANRSKFLGRSAVEVTALGGARCGPLDLPENAQCNCARRGVIVLSFYGYY
jgi:hypothetical protein